MSDAADKRIAELEQRVKELGWENANLRKSREMNEKINTELRDRDLAHIEHLRKQLVERDVYEAEQRLPPEQAALIRHLATVERCIAEGPVTYHYAEESDCSFCGEWQGHTRDCAWFALQMDRGVTSVIDDIHAVALREDERRERQRMPIAGHSHRQSPATLEQMNNIFREVYGMRVEANPLVPPGTAYLTNLSDFRGIPALRQGAGLESPIAMQMRLEAEAALRQEPAQLVQSDWHVLTPEERYEDSGGVAGSAPSAVAPPDDEDVP